MALKLSARIVTASKGEIQDIDTQLLDDTDVLVTTTGNIDVCDSAMLQCLKRLDRL